MRKASFLFCRVLFTKFGVDPAAGRAIDVGGADRIVYLKKKMPNPLLECSPDLDFFDNGFLGSDNRDFLNEDDVAPLEGKYNIVYSFDTLEHVKDPWLFYKNMVRVSKKGGHIFIAAPFRRPYHPSPGDYWRFTPEGLKLLFEKMDNVKVLAAEWDIDLVGSVLLVRRTE